MAPVLVGAQLHLNTLTSGYQGQVRIDALKDGGFVAVWEDHSQIAGGVKVIRGQLFNADGTKKGAELAISATSEGMRARPSLAVLNDGRFVVTWDDSTSVEDGSNSGVLARIYDGNGVAEGDPFLVNTTKLSHQFQPSVAALANGGFAIAFASLASDGSNNDIKSQVYGANLSRIGGEVPINTTTADNQLEAHTIRCGEGYAVFYNDYSNSSDDAVGFTLRGRILAADGQEIKAEFLVPTAGPGRKGSAAAASLTNGTFVVTWTTDAGGTVDTIAQIFKADGTRIGEEFIVSGGADTQIYSVVTALPDGGFAITYDYIIEPNGTDPGRTEIRLSVFNADGSRRLETDFLVATFSAAHHEKPDITVLANGRLMIAWENPLTTPEEAAGGLYAQLVDVSGPPGNQAPSDIDLTNFVPPREVSATGTVIGELTAADPNGADAFTYILTNTAGGRFGVAQDETTGLWKLVVANGYLLDYEQARSHIVRVKVIDGGGLSYEKDLTINIGNWSIENIYGTAGNDVFTGGVSKDKIQGGSGNDKLNGGYGNDTLYGGSGKDAFVFNTKLSKYSNVDRIADYSTKYDTIYLENAIFRKLKKTGAPSRSYFEVGSRADDRDDYILYNKKTGYLCYDADGSGSKYKAIAFAKLKAGLKMAASEFKVI